MVTVCTGLYALTTALSIFYTNLQLIDTHDKLTKLIKKMYQNANAHYILVNSYTGKAFWSHTDKGSCNSFSLQHLLMPWSSF